MSAHRPLTTRPRRSERSSLAGVAAVIGREPLGSQERHGTTWRARHGRLWQAATGGACGRGAETALPTRSTAVCDRALARVARV